jgi:hypothetical protein
MRGGGVEVKTSRVHSSYTCTLIASAKTSLEIIKKDTKCCHHISTTTFLTVEMQLKTLKSFPVDSSVGSGSDSPRSAHPLQDLPVQTLCEARSRKPGTIFIIHVLEKVGTLVRSYL